jgi:hypothetical protein
MEIMKQVHIHFDSGQSERSVTLDRRISLVKSVAIRAISYAGIPAGTTEVAIVIDNFSANISTEGRTGFPLPITTVDGTSGMVYYNPPFHISSPTLNTVQQLNVRLRDVNEAAFTHTGLSLWLCFYTKERGYSIEEARRNMNFNQPHNAMSGAGRHDTRWDYIPDIADIEQSNAERRSRLFLK